MLKPIDLSVDTVTNQIVENYEDISKGDTLIFTINMYQDTAQLDLTGQTIHVILRKSDGKNLENIITGVIGNEFITEFPQQATLIEGTVKGEVKLIDSEGASTSNKFTFEVGETLGTDIVEKSADAIQTLKDIDDALDVSVTNEIAQSRGTFEKLSYRLKDSDDILTETSKTTQNQKIARTLNYDFDGFIPAQNVNKHLQSICYVPDNNVLVAAYNNKVTEGLGDIVKFDASTKEVIKVYTDMQIYHANDMTYNADTDEIVLVPMSDTRGYNYVYIYDYPTMTKKKEIQISAFESTHYVSSIAYNRLDESYIIYSGQILYIFDTNFNLIRQFDIVRDDSLVLQSIEVVDSLIFISFQTAMWVCDFQGNVIRTYSIDRVGESEGLAYIGNNEFFVGNVINSTIYMTSTRIFKFNIYMDYDVYNWHTYSSLEEIGIATGSETIENICYALPNNSRIIYDKVVANTATCYPVSSGTFEAIRKNSTKVHLKFYNAATSKSDTYIGLFNVNVSPVWTGWNKLADGTDSGWIEAVLSSGVTNYSTSTLKYRKIGNRVYIIGAVTNITALNTIITNMPTGFRPSASRTLALCGSGNRFNRISISTTGDMKLENTSYTGTLLASDWYPIIDSYLID